MINFLNYLPAIIEIKFFVTAIFSQLIIA